MPSTLVEWSHWKRPKCQASQSLVLELSGAYQINGGRVILTKSDASCLYVIFVSQFYWNETLAKRPRKSVLVVRQESLQQDLQDLEQFLAGPQPDSQPLQFYPLDSIHFVSGKVSTQLRNNHQRNKLCCALFPDEWPIYATLIQRAENLSMPQKVASLQSTWSECGTEKHPADIESILQEAKTLQDWSQAFVGDVCRKYFAGDDAISKNGQRILA